MSTVEAIPFKMPRPVSRKIARVRRLLRLYVLLDGIAALLLVLGCAFWMGLAIDWLLEPSPWVRMALWAIVLAASLLVAMRLILRRVFARLPRASIALVLERQFPDLRESLVTTVEAAERSTMASPFHPTMLRQTSRIAAEGIADVPIAQVLNTKPLVWKAIAAAVMVVSIASFATAHREGFDFYLSRLRLSNQPWPRQVQLQLQNFGGNTQNNTQNKNTHRIANVARDDDFQLNVLASIQDGHTAPESVEIRYRLADGRRGRDTMTQVGSALPGRDAAQQYRYQFKHVVADLDFEIVGGDDRIRDLHLRVVERPQIMKMVVDVKTPQYLRREPRSFEISGRLELPEGANATCLLRANKSLRHVRVHNPIDQTDLAVQVDPDQAKQFHFVLNRVSEDRTLMITLHGEDGVENREPYQLIVSIVHDELPEVSVQLRGIGSAITPQATIPLAGQIADDYGIEKVWFEYHTDGQQLERRNMQKSPGGMREFRSLDRFDLTEVDPATGRPFTELKPGQKLALSIQASDAYNLTETPRHGSSQRFLLDVVTPSALRAILEKRELGLRQRFEAIYEKMLAIRDLLDRIGAHKTPLPTVDESEGETSEEEIARNRQRNRLRVASLLQNVTQSAYETLGVADGFENIVAELMNNRVDTEELKKRLQQEIAEPLEEIGRDKMPELERRLQSVQTAMSESALARPAMLAARQQGDEVLEAMKGVLDRMLELESYNELVELLRGIAAEQLQLNEETKRQQRARLRGLLDE